MLSADGRYVTVFNGEIYNFRELRSELEALGRTFRSTSDTEVMLEGFSEWGVLPTVRRLVGMFAIALWDTLERRLHLIRDRMGEKPLYYGRAGTDFIFGSELKALRAHPDFPAEVDRSALTLFLRYSYIPAPYSICKSVKKLPPGTILTLDPHNPLAEVEPVSYWSVRAAVEAGLAQPFRGSVKEGVAELERLLIQAVRGQMIADVPLGAFLSGGIDSSTVVALMQAASDRPVRTFTVGFNEKGYDEADHAALVAKHLRTYHTQIDVTPVEALNLIPRLPQLYDEPFADPSQIPTHLVAALGRRHVTVSLTGDGGDELFAGYDRYRMGQRLWEKTRRVPLPLKRMALATFERLMSSRIGFLVPGAARVGKGLALLAAPTPEDAFHQVVSHWKLPASVVVDGFEPPTIHTEPARWVAHPDLIARMMYLDAVGYLPDGILVKLDRAAMGVSLEGRIPMLDHRVVEFAWSLPQEWKLRHGTGKWILRQVLYRHVPKDLVNRPKHGFTVPLAQWLSGPLREWAEALLDENRLRHEGYLNPVAVRSRWRDHLAGRHTWSGHLWNVLMFQAWLAEQKR